MEIIRGRFGNPPAENKLLWASYYEAVLGILGTTGIIIPMGDTNHEAANRTTVTTVGENASVFTYSEAVTSFATPPYFKGPGHIPIITFNGTDEEADSPDAAYWTRADAAFSVGAWVNLTDATSSTVLSKLDTAGNTREWEFGFSSADKAILFIYDEDDAQNDFISVTAAAAQAQSTWVFVVATLPGDDDETSMNLYYDGVVEGSPARADSGDFGQMRDTNSTVKLAHSNATPANLFDGQMASGPLAPFFTQTELTADAILRLYQLGRAALGV